MRHFVIAAAMLLAALVVTLGAATVLQVVATRQKSPTGAFIEPAAPAFAPFTTKERMGQSYHPARSETRYTRG
ncbi:MAG: hypothetical protein JSR91_07660 [Proteobacteria bacterium]|nr:hypothetical protein [Pseudomonadota bacterium]